MQQTNKANNHLNVHFVSCSNAVQCSSYAKKYLKNSKNDCLKRGQNLTKHLMLNNVRNSSKNLAFFKYRMIRPNFTHLQNL